MWSEKKYIDIVINILIVLLSMYFLHLSQFILPIICLILFVENHFTINIYNLKLFLLLVIFGISFFCFSYKLGFFSTMGFCLPMAYYIGSNLKVKNDENVKKIIYLIAIGMQIHVLLNFAYDIYMYRSEFVIHRSHYDFWLKDIVNTPTTAVNYVIPTSIIYYLLAKEKDAKFKLPMLLMYTVMMIYNIFLGRRTPLLMLIMVIMIGFAIDYKNIVDYKKIKISFAALMFFVFLGYLVVHFNLFGLGDKFYTLHIVSKFVVFGLDAGRLDILLDALKYFPQYPYGGQFIANTIGIQIHDLWSDIYDFAGIVPFICIVIYTLYTLVNSIKIVFAKELSYDYKLLLSIFWICCFIEMCLEPIMTGSSIFLISFVIICSASDLWRTR